MTFIINIFQLSVIFHMFDSAVNFALNRVQCRITLIFALMIIHIIAKTSAEQMTFLVTIFQLTVLILMFDNALNFALNCFQRRIALKLAILIIRPIAKTSAERMTFIVNIFQLSIIILLFESAIHFALHYVKRRIVLIFAICIIRLIAKTSAK